VLWGIGNDANAVKEGEEAEVDPRTAHLLRVTERSLDRQGVLIVELPQYAVCKLDFLKTSPRMVCMDGIAGGGSRR